MFCFQVFLSGNYDCYRDPFLDVAQTLDTPSEACTEVGDETLFGGSGLMETSYAGNEGQNIAPER